MTSRKHDWGPYGPVNDHPDQIQRDRELTDADIDAMAQAMRHPLYRQFIESLEDVEDELGLGDDLPLAEAEQLTPQELAYLQAFYPLPKPQDYTALELLIKRKLNEQKPE